MFAHAFVCLGAVLVLYVLWRFRTNHLKAVEMLLERTETIHAKQIMLLQAEIDKKQRVITAQKRANGLM